MSKFIPIIYRYHSINRPPVCFYGSKDFKNDLFLGIELEFDTRNSNSAYIYNKKHLIEQSNILWDSNIFIYYMNDGSLCNGLEMITQPATYEYHVVNKENYEKLFNIITSHGFKSQSYQNCGLHIHFNKSFFESNLDLYTMNLLYIIEKFWKEVVLLSRRNYPSIVKWANKYDESPEKIVENTKKQYLSLSRYRAINLTNTDTIEFRIYRGTLDINDFFSILEFTKNVIICAKTYSPIQLQSMSFEELINTSPELIRYYKKCNRKSAIEKLPDFLQ